MTAGSSRWHLDAGADDLSRDYLIAYLMSQMGRIIQYGNARKVDKQTGVGMKGGRGRKREKKVNLMDSREQEFVTRAIVSTT